MSASLERIKIVGLHGNKTVDIEIKDNTLILVGENGSGKTTILRILFHFLSGSWQSLYDSRFDEIVATIDGTEHKVIRNEIMKNVDINPQLLRNLPPPIRLRVEELAVTSQLDQVSTDTKLQTMMDHYGVPLEMIMHQIGISVEMDELKEIIHGVCSTISAEILYLPTYRRIERELSSIYENVGPERVPRQRSRPRPSGTDEGFIEYVEFGMKDVQDDIDRELAKIREFARMNLNNLTLRYLGDVVNAEYQSVDINEISKVSKETVDHVLDHIDPNILTEKDKILLREEIDMARSGDELNERNKIIYHYFLKLLEFQDSLKEREKPISDFCKLCSEYTVDKQLVYDSSDFSFSIVTKAVHPEKIKLSDLSSGEKQIVSLFSHLYLSRQDSYFVLIDEPELSLSVPWQRRFLVDIHNGGFCSGLIAATHSPFIYENDLRDYAHSLGEFTSI